MYDSLHIGLHIYICIYISVTTYNTWTLDPSLNAENSTLEIFSFRSRITLQRPDTSLYITIHVHLFPTSSFFSPSSLPYLCHPYGRFRSPSLVIYVLYIALAIIARSFASAGRFSLVVVCTELRSMDMLGQTNHETWAIQRSEGGGGRARGRLGGWGGLEGVSNFTYPSCQLLLSGIPIPRH